jgi:hypothetical protein
MTSHGTLALSPLMIGHSALIPSFAARAPQPPAYGEKWMYGVLVRGSVPVIARASTLP